MKPSAPPNWNPSRLDVRAFALAGQSLEVVTEMVALERLSAETVADGDAAAPVRWQCRGEMRPDARGKSVPWLHLQAEAAVSLTCQRCLGPVSENLEVDRWFRFVADEATAELEDEDSEEDVLALEPRPNILGLVEDELLMALPLVPLHETCPVPVPMQAGELADMGESEQPLRKNAFEALAQLKK